MSRLNIRTHCAKVGIENPNQLQRALGCHIDTATQLWKETVKRIDIENLASLRTVLGVSLDQIILPKPKKEQSK